MFTGLVEGQGNVRVLKKEPEGLRLTIAPAAGCFLPLDVSIGDSISISGCCLTVVAIEDESFDFEAGEETLSKTNLGDLRAGSSVNLERSLLRRVLVGMYSRQLSKPDVDKILAELGHDGETRAEALDVPTLVRLGNRFNQEVNAAKPDGRGSEEGIE